MKTYVYVDGFNLYYGAVRRTRYKWLDIARMCRLLLPRHEILRIKYFTARVSARPGDFDKPTRQQTFLRTLGTLPNCDIIYGHFMASEVTMRLAHSHPSGPKYATVVKTEEKGSDVNLATHLLWDGFRDLYEAAILVTNDSDLVEAVRIVRHELGRTVGVLNPHENLSKMLLKHATFLKPIREGVLAASQFPTVLRDAHGSFSKPATW
jgi:uncharacterized LabA/DUF88 family protein